jgi:hypothetical protein
MRHGSTGDANDFRRSADVRLDVLACDRIASPG